MRIFFITNNYTPYCAGVTQSIISTTDALRAQGHELFIITLNFSNTTYATDPDYVIRIPCPIKFIYKKNPMAIPWRPTHTIMQLIEQYKPDIIHVHHPFLLGISGLRAARRYGIPCVFTYHTLYEQYTHYLPIPDFCAKPLIQLTVTKFCNAIDGIIAPSSTVKNFLTTQKITTPITIIPSAIRSFFFTQTNIPKTIHTKTTIKLLVVSRFVPEKNIPFIFDLFKKLPALFTITLVGYGSQYEEMQQLAFNTLQLSPDRVRFIHQPAQDDLLSYYRNADLFLFPSQTDTQGLVLAESMSQGVPVIALHGAGQQDIIINGVNGFLINNADEAAATIINIANNPQLYAQLSSHAQITAQHYHTNTIVHQLLRFYTTICL